MKKLIIAALCVTFLSCTSTQEKPKNLYKGTVEEISYDHYTNEKYLIKSKGILKKDQAYHTQLYTGTFVGYNTDNKIVFEGKYVNGKREGKHIDYYDNGNIEFIWNFKNDRLHGKHIRYYRSGNIMFIGHYKNGILHGDYIDYYENGNIKSKMTFKDGKLIVDQINYDINGNIIH